jgi:hypothetical protein
MSTRFVTLDRDTPLLLPVDLRDWLTSDVSERKKELRIALLPLSSPHRTQAVAAMCQELDRRKVLFPGSHLRIASVLPPVPPEAKKSRQIPKRVCQEV